LVVCNETTEDVLVHKKLEANERKLKSIIIQAPVAIAIFRGADYVVEIVNELALELWGRKKEEVINQPILKAMPELSGQGIKELLDNVYKTGELFSANELPVQILRKGQLKTAYINFVYEPVYDVDGTINGVMTVGTDVTPHVTGREKLKENEAKLKESAERLILATEGTQMATWDLNLQTNDIVHSPRLAEIFGYENESKILSHEQMLDHIHPDDLHPVVEKAFNEALKTGT